MKPIAIKSYLSQERTTIAAYVLLILGTLALLTFFPIGTVSDRLHILSSGLCGQDSSHVIVISGHYLPLCARNTGIFLGYLIALTGLSIRGRGKAQQLPPLAIRVILIALIGLMAVDGLNSLLLDLYLPHLYQPQNTLRLATGLGSGFASAMLLHPMLNRLLWCGYNEIESLPDWKTLCSFLGILSLCFVVILTKNTMIYYPVALLSTSGTIGVLLSFNLIILITLWQREENIANYRELLPFFSIALLCAPGELLLFAQGKHWLLIFMNRA